MICYELLPGPSGASGGRATAAEVSKSLTARCNITVIQNQPADSNVPLEEHRTRASRYSPLASGLVHASGTFVGELRKERRRAREKSAQI